MTYDDAIAHLDSFTNYEHQHQPQAMREVKLERMQRLCSRLGDPQRRFRSVIVAGTNGKGSICAMLYSMLRESALRVGLYTSPHLENLRERIRVWTSTEQPAERIPGDDWISETEFATAMEQLQPTLESMRRDPSFGPPTYFEVLTALALVHFRQRQVDVAILEVGLGGRLDATNVVEPDVSVIAPIDLDHTDVLGQEPRQIAHEKAGIIKPGQVVLSAAQREEVWDALRTVCEEQGVPLLRYGRELSGRVERHTLEGLHVSLTGLRGIYESLSLPLLGRHQAQNAALAVGALEALSTSGVPHSLVERGLARVAWPGRIEVVQGAPLVLMDGAHNAHAASALAATLAELCPGRRIHLLVGMSADKSVEGFGEQLGSLVVGATCTKSRHPRALDPTTLAKRLAPLCQDVHVMSDLADAYTYLLNAVSPNDVIVVSGSLFLVGELRTALRHADIEVESRGRQRDWEGTAQVQTVE